MSDTGCGIAAEELEELFNAFAQAKHSQQAHEGTGLGLTISRHFVNLMGGEITVQSALGQGSTFAFDIQVGVDDVSQLPAPVESRRVLTLAQDQGPCRVLIVEDQWQNRHLLVELLTSIGFEIYEAVNGEEAIAHWSSWNPHLILMDLRMPELNGFEAVEQIRQKEQESNKISPQSCVPTKIIALTADAFEETKVAALTAGCDDFIRKPIQENLLLTKIAEHLGIQYIYELADHRPSEPQSYSENLSSHLALMPLPWIKQVHQAAVEGFDNRILQLTEEIPEAQSSLADALNNWAINFQFESIIQLTQPLVDA
ncbi:MAG: hypothetical protein Fur0046_00320 [Cyanobacteria bacterium J069]